MAAALLLRLLVWCLVAAALSVETKEKKSLWGLLGLKNRSTKSPSLSAQEGEGRNPTTLRESQVTPSLTLSQLGEQKDRKEEKSKTVDGEEDDKRRRQASASRLNKILSALSASSAATANKKEWEDLRPGDHHSEGSKAPSDTQGTLLQEEEDEEGSSAGNPEQQAAQRQVMEEMTDLAVKLDKLTTESAKKIIHAHKDPSKPELSDQDISTIKTGFTTYVTAHQQAIDAFKTAIQSVVQASNPQTHKAMEDAQSAAGLPQNPLVGPHLVTAAQRDFGGQGGAGVSPSQQMRMNVDYMQRLMASHMNDLTKDFRQRMLDSVLQVLSRNQASSNAMPPDQVLRDAVREEVSKVIRKARGGQSGSYPMPGAMYPNPGQVVPYTQPGMPPQNYPYPLPRGGADREELDFLDDADSGIGIEG